MANQEIKEKAKKVVEDQIEDKIEDKIKNDISASVDIPPNMSSPQVKGNNSQEEEAMAGQLKKDQTQTKRPKRPEMPKELGLAEEPKLPGQNQANPVATKKQNQIQNSLGPNLPIGNQDRQSIGKEKNTKSGSLDVNPEQQNKIGENFNTQQAEARQINKTKEGSQVGVKIKAPETESLKSKKNYSRRLIAWYSVLVTFGMSLGQIILQFIKSKGKPKNYKFRKWEKFVLSCSCFFYLIFLLVSVVILLIMPPIPTLIVGLRVLNWLTRTWDKLTSIF